ncbi:MAG: hypothetical protein ACRED5_16160 [Propylenella sp.]
MRIAAALSGVCFAHAAFASPALAQTKEPGSGNGGAALAPVVHQHSGRPLRRVKTKTPAAAADLWSLDFHAGASHESFSGPFAPEDQLNTFADLFAAKGGTQLGLHYLTEEESGRLDTTLGVSLAAPLSSRLNVSFETDVSVDRVFQPDYSVRLGGSYLVHYDTATESFVSVSLSSQAEGFEYGYSLSLNPSLIVGSSTGVVLTVGYTFGELFDASSAPQTALSQASYTEGWSIGATISPTAALSLDFLFLPENRTVLNGSQTTETTFRAGLDYAFHKRFTGGLAVEFGTTSAPIVGDLYDSVKYEGSFKLSF